MTYLSELELTPTQMNELEDSDPELVAQWLEAVSTKTGIKSPAGWFLAGIRSGKRPGEQHDPSRTKAVDLAERYIRNAGLYLPDETSVIDELFGQRGRLKTWTTDPTLQERMLIHWRAEQPRVEEAEAESLARAARWRTTNHVPDLPDKPPIQIPW